MFKNIWKFERKNSQEDHRMVWNRTTNCPVEKGLFSLFLLQRLDYSNSNWVVSQSPLTYNHFPWICPLVIYYRLFETLAVSNYLFVSPKTLKKPRSTALSPTKKLKYGQAHLISRIKYRLAWHSNEWFKWPRWKLQFCNHKRSNQVWQIFFFQLC